MERGGAAGLHGADDGRSSFLLEHLLIFSRYTRTLINPGSSVLLGSLCCASSIGLLAGLGGHVDIAHKLEGHYSLYWIPSCLTFTLPPSRVALAFGHPIVRINCPEV